MTRRFGHVPRTRGGFFRLAVAALSCLVLLGASEDGSPEHTTAGGRLLGQWYTEDRGIRIRIERKDGRFRGKIVWMREPNYPEGHELEGQPKIDRFNPDPRKRRRPVMGLTVLDGFTYAGDGRWTGGTIYDADCGKTYRSYITLSGPDTVKVRGYIGISLIGRTTTAYRYRPEKERMQVQGDTKE